MAAPRPARCDPRATRRAPAGRWIRRASAFREARDRATCPTCCAPGICWSSTTPPRCRPRCAGGTRRGAPIELRLLAATDDGAGIFQRRAVRGRRLAPAHRGSPAPSAARRSARACGSERSARACWSCGALSPRLVRVAFDASGDGAVGRALPRGRARCSTRTRRTSCRCGRCRRSTPARPWAFEMPSAGRPLSWDILLALRRRRRALGRADPRRRAQRHRRSRARRRAAAARALRDPRGDGARRSRRRAPAAGASSPSAPRWCARSRGPPRRAAERCAPGRG